MSPMVGELLSGSSPPSSFFNPFSLFILSGLYGSGALIVRESVRRWGKGWPSVLLLGAAYGILEEGVMVKSFFDPSWPDLGLLGVYGRWMGVNWVWAEWLTIYHAIYSITIPILLIELLFPAYRRSNYLDRRGLAFFFGLISFVIIFGHIYLTPYRLTLVELLSCFIAIAVLIILAKRIQCRRFCGSGRGANTFRLWALGTISGFAYFIFIYNILPSNGIPVLLTLAIGLGYTGLIAGLVSRASRDGMSKLNGIGLASGFMSLLFFLDFALEMSKPGNENYTGEIAVAISFMIFLVLLRRKVRGMRSDLASHH